ncbi:hypothetical protein [Serratia liquefaciens]|uniref:hypothetical protein n=1 Tax=Serratia liquefaciens TaxID=614 RepID=UPI00163DA884|nr:hypothetical protein [Serratia liquefaciens]
MNHIQFIEKHIKEKLIDAGFSVAIAQGGQMKVLTSTSVARRPAPRERCLMIATGTPGYGPKRTARLWINRLRKNKAELRQQLGLHCFN